MKATCLIFCLLAMTAGKAWSADIIAQEYTVMTGITESTVAGQLQIAPAPGESGAFVEIPVLLPKQVASTLAAAYAAAQPSLAVGSQNFLPIGYRTADQPIRGLPHGWKTGIFQFQIPPQFASSGFIGKLMYVQPQIKDVTPFLSLASQAAPSSSKITFLPGNSHSIGLISKNTEAASMENGMLSMRPVNEELILIGRRSVKEPKKIDTEKPPKSRVIWNNPFDGLPFWRKKDPKPAPTPKPSILPPAPQ